MHVVVIGGGPAGVAGAVRAADLGARVTVVEESLLGGTCVNSGCVPVRVLARTARMMREARTAATWGVIAREVELDWSEVRRRVATTVELVHAAKQTAAVLDRAGVEVLLGERASFLAADTVDVGGRRLRPDAVLLCVGGEARRPPFAGAELCDVPSDVVDWHELPRRAVVVGSGNTGVQLVTVLDALGCDVALVDVADRILPTADDDVSTALRAAFESQGVAVHTGVGVDAVTEAGSERHVRLSDGTVVAADRVVAAVGWPTRTAGLGLDAAGIDHRPGIIPVDEHLRTSVPHVFAAGDANQQHMLVQSAEVEAASAARNAVLGVGEATPHTLLPWGGFTDPDVAGVGLTEVEARHRYGDCAVARVDLAELERAVIDDRTAGFCKLVADPRRTRLLGAHVIGESAVEIVQAVTTAMAAGARPETLADVEFAYPTFTAIVGAAARRLLAS